MIDPRILLVAKGDQLTASVRSALSSLPMVRFHVVESCAEVLPCLGDAAMVIVHVSARQDAEKAAGLLRQLASANHGAPTLLVCETELANEGLKLLRLGAADCLMRPLDLTRLAYLADVLTVRYRLAPRTQARAAAACSHEKYAFIHQANDSLSVMMEQVRQVAPLETSVLLQGETGTGKTRLARLIHELSSRREQPFLTINCGALSSNLIESELFGHVRGAFTGAERDRAGKLDAVGAGTLLLDDIDGLPLDLQPRLLRVIEERVFEPVGSNKSQPFRARVIAASNRPLQQEAQAGKFRSDLYYRLGVMVFYLPPFRENRGLVAALAQHFVEEYAARDQRPIVGVAASALRALEAYDWPGNVRELRNVIERGVALSTGPWINWEDLPEPLRAASPAAPNLAPSPVPSTSAITLAERKKETEALAIREVLTRNNNNKLRTAAELGISRMTLYKKLSDYGLIAPSAPAPQWA